MTLTTTAKSISLPAILLQGCLFFFSPATHATQDDDKAITCNESGKQIHYTIRSRAPSLFGDVLVVDSKSQRNLRFEDPCGPDQSSIDLNNTNRVIMEYVRHASLGIAYTPHLEKALVIGMGGGVFSNLLLKHLPQVQVDSVEIDPAVVTAAKTYFGMTESSKHHIYIQDAAKYMEETKEKYDLILLDAYDADGIPEHLATQVFFNKAAEKLTSNGVIVANFGLDTPRRYLKLAEKLRKATGDTRCLHGKEEANLVVIASTPSTIQAEKALPHINVDYALDAIAKQLKVCPRI